MLRAQVLMCPMLMHIVIPGRLQAIMPDGCETSRSETECSCASIPPPINLECRGAPNASVLSWDPVPGAISYKVTIGISDPACCAGPAGLSGELDAVGTSISIPSTFATCFSWHVVAMMPYGVPSAPSVTRCSCTPEAPAPTNLDCVRNSDGGSTLSWSPIPGAVYYELHMIQGDPLCCPNSTLATFIKWSVSGTGTNVPNSYAACFSWRVVAVMPDSSRTQSSVTKCSCSVPPLPRPGNAPADEGSNTTAGKELSVSAVPNPASAYITFTVQSTSGKSSTGQLRLYLYDANGKEVIRKDLLEDKVRLDIRAYTDGVYIYEIRDQRHTLYKNKVIIEKH